MEAVVWLFVALLSWKLFEKKYSIPARRKYFYLSLVGFGAVALFVFFRLLLKLNHTSLWFLLAILCLSAQTAYTLAQLLFARVSVKTQIIPSLKAMTGCILLLFFFYNLGGRIIGIDLGNGRFMPITVASSTILILSGTAIWIYGAQLLKKAPSFAYAIYIGTISLTPIFLFFIMELSWNSKICDIIIFDLLLNLLIYGLLELIFINIGKKRLIGLRLLYILIFGIGVINYFVLNFRGQPIMVADLFAVQTAFAVAGEYHFQMWDGIASAGVILYLIIALLSALAQADVTERHAFSSKAVRPAASLIALSGLLFWISATDFSQKYEVFLDFWNPNSTYQATGFLPGFISFMQKTKIKAPDNYRAELAESILQPYAESEQTAESDSSLKPTIIAIMNESFSDLSALGPLNCTDEHLSFLHALKDDPHTLEYGYNYVSTRGGGTSTTEFEFLTGNSMSQLPGINPYAILDFKNTPSLVHQLKQQGYHTIAMHPENPRNWRRNAVYPELGFDSFLSIDDFAGQEQTIYGRISDYGDYQKLIEVYEQQTGPAFIFNVTMQNHGGYDLSVLPEAEQVSVDEAYRQYTDFQMYQSLIKKSDDALRALIQYFSEVEEPVLICFFGDHQPALDATFESTLLASGQSEEESAIQHQEKYYAVPYFIWSNFETNASSALATNASSEAGGGSSSSVISTNYLGPLLLQYAGLKRSAYSNYLLQQREYLPVLNLIGYLGRDQRWYALEEDSAYRKWITDYNYVQYQALFDRKKKTFLYEIRQ